jgi:hypothetical protein
MSRRKFRPWLALLALAASGLVCSAESIKVVETRAIDAQRLPALANGTHRLTLYAHTFKGTRWTQDEVVNAVAGAAQLLGQCGIAVHSAELRVIEAPGRFQYYHTPDSRELLRGIQTPKPAVFFVEDTRNNPAFDAEAIGFSNSKRRPELVNTVWVAHGARDLPYALAHELVHVLSDSGQHTDEPGNLMRAETAPQNRHLTAAQCELMRSRGVANGLLENNSGHGNTETEK